MFDHRSRIVGSAIFLLLLLVATETLVLAETKTVTIAVSWDGKTKERFDAFVESFEREHPDIKIEHLNKNISTSEFITQAVAGVAPDIFAHVPRRPVELAEEGLIEDLTPFIERTPEFGYEEDYFPLAQEPWVVDGRVYGLALDVGAVAVYYRTDLFAQAGLLEPTFDWTNEDMFKAAQKLTVKDSEGSIQRWGLGGTWLWWLNAPMLAGFGVTLYDYDTGMVFEPADKATEALQWWSDLTLAHEVAEPYGWNLAEDKTAMSFQGTWGFHYWVYELNLFDGAVDIAPVPRGPAGRYTTLAGAAYGMCGTSKVKDEAWIFLSELLNPHNLATIYPSGPPRRSVLQQWGEQWGEKGAHARRVLGEALDSTGIYLPTLPPDVNTMVNEHLTRIIKGEIPARTAVQVAREQCAAMLRDGSAD